jgi:hypothetical protein
MIDDAGQLWRTVTGVVKGGELTWSDEEGESWDDILQPLARRLPDMRSVCLSVRPHARPSEHDRRQQTRPCVCLSACRSVQPLHSPGHHRQPGTRQVCQCFYVCLSVRLPRFVLSAIDEPRILPGDGPDEEIIASAMCANASEEFLKYRSLHGFFIAPATYAITHELVPVFSPTKINRCAAIGMPLPLGCWGRRLRVFLGL